MSLIPIDVPDTMSFTVEWAEKVHVWQLGIARDRLAVGTHAQTEAEGPVSHRAERARRAKRALKLKVAEPFRLVSSPSFCLSSATTCLSSLGRSGPFFSGPAGSRARRPSERYPS